MRAARRLINMSLLFRRLSGVLRHTRNVIFIEENQEIALYAFSGDVFNYYSSYKRFLYCYIIMMVSGVF